MPGPSFLHFPRFAILSQLIRSKEWESVLFNYLNLLVDAGFWSAECYRLEARYGQRKFNVWRILGEDRVILLKEIKATPLLMSCSYLVGAQALEAAVALMSGREATPTCFCGFSAHALFLVAHLEEAVFEEASNQ